MPVVCRTGPGCAPIEPVPSPADRVDGTQQQEPRMADSDSPCTTCNDAATCSGTCDAKEQAERTHAMRRLRTKLDAIRHKLLVFSGKGGVGKSTVAVNLAAGLAMDGHRVGLLDVDFHGPTVPILLGIQGQRALSDGLDLLPVEPLANLKVMSIGLLVEHPEEAIIWRGPMKIGVIQQLLRDVAWGELDFLIVDSPPGTGDEPLSVAQTIPELDGAVLVTTPQAVSVADVRRSITFCRKVDMPVLGVVENMSGFACPKCGEVTHVFRQGGGERMARDMGVPFLGAIPLDPEVVRSGDAGTAFVKTATGSASVQAFRRIAHVLAERVG